MKTILSFILFFTLVSCKKTEPPEPPQDYSNSIAGIYYVTSINEDGISTVTVTDKNDYIQITRSDLNKVTIVVHLTTGVTTLYNVTVSNGSNGKINFLYTDASAQISGSEKNGSLTFIDALYDVADDFVVVEAQK